MKVRKSDEYRYSRVAYLEHRARRRMPHFAREYLDSGTGDELALPLNRAAVNAIQMVPRFLRGVSTADTSCDFLGRSYAAPIGMAPIGLQGMLWPGAEKILAGAAARHRLAYCLSTVATQDPETIAPVAGDMGWYQFYPPRDAALGADLLRRVAAAGFGTLLVTVDIPADSRRERARRAGLRVPLRITPALLWQAASHPRWSAATLRHGLPRLRTLEPYFGRSSLMTLSNQVTNWSRHSPDWDYVKAIRDQWSGKLLLKGLLHAEDAEQAVASGMDGIVVSSHGARMLDGAPPAIAMLPKIVARVGGKLGIVFDTGIRGGLDIARALALGADFVLLGRAFMYGVCALGQRGGDHMATMLIDDLRNVMTQLGCRTVGELRHATLYHSPF